MVFIESYKFIYTSNDRFIMAFKDLCKQLHAAACSHRLASVKWCKGGQLIASCCSQHHEVITDNPLLASITGQLDFKMLGQRQLVIILILFPSH